MCAIGMQEMIATEVHLIDCNRIEMAFGDLFFSMSTHRGIDKTFN